VPQFAKSEAASRGFALSMRATRRDYGAVETDSEFVHLFGADLDVDRSIVTSMPEFPRQARTERRCARLRLTLEAAIINGDSHL